MGEAERADGGRGDGAKALLDAGRSGAAASGKAAMKAASVVPAASPAQAHQLAPAERRGQRKGEPLGTTRRDLLLDPARAGGGEALTVTTSEAGAPSSDGLSSTLFYLQEAAADPQASEAELWTRATRRDINYGGAVTTLQQPRAPAARSAGAPTSGGVDPWAKMLPEPMPRDQLGPRAAPPRADKRALVIGNSDYPASSKLSPLMGAGRDAELMAQRYEARGFGVVKHKNVKVGELKSLIEGFSRGLGRGDEAGLYFAGHGDEGALTGMDSRIAEGKIAPVVPASVPSGAVGAALSAGAKLELVIDACDSGPIQDQLLAEHGHKAQGQVTDVQGFDREAEAERGVHLHNDESGITFHNSDLSAAYAHTYDAGQQAVTDRAAAEAREAAKRAKSSAAKAGGAPSGLGGVKADAAR